jgi:hypothetical protein
MKSKFSWNPEIITSVCAIFISLMTLVVFIYQTNIIRKEQRLSALPYMTMGNQGFGSPTFKLIIKNDGIGPAFVKDITIKYEGKTYESDLPQFLYEHIPGMDTIENILHSNINPGYLIPAGRVIPILEVNNSLSSSQQLIRIFEEHDITMELVYESIYEEQWLLSSDEGFPQKIE